MSGPEGYKRRFDLCLLAVAGLGLLPLWLALGAAIALAQGRVLGAKRLKSRLLAVEQRPQGRRKR